MTELATVAIVQRRLTHYRLPLFEQMRARLQASKVRLRLLHGVGTAAEASKQDAGSLDWAETLPTYYGPGGTCWQPFAERTRGCDLVVITQENKLLNNLPPLLNPWRRQRLAFWGHGANLQSGNPDGMAERFKRWTTTRVDWWFAYTELSAALVRQAGFDETRITVLNNSIDTDALAEQVAQARSQGRAALRARLGVGEGPLGLFIGSLYPDKRLPFLLDAARALRDRLPGFELVIAGSGPQASLVQAAATPGSGLRYLGPVKGQAKADWLVAADLMLNPGAVGLAILDAFVAGLPVVTTDCRLHGPEIAYLDSGRNGLMTVNDPNSYVEACHQLLLQATALAAMGRVSAASASRYSVQAMAAKFASGIETCLSTAARERAGASRSST